ncbi:hypothetical protein PYCCODRAFT_1357246 [Trametes coccinea BRFM310]|uniref:Uncharacterized protein n=1 Tax=Trametes coccinea (strain BRFM310) TaxID=1353009 RepID=A0A1Y2J5Q0_TRAC3|nr:hypothetical protein PYCCODRAFT_1357246 [Trametes coccinea BRFM310]
MGRTSRAPSTSAFRASSASNTSSPSPSSSSSSPSPSSQSSPSPPPSQSSPSPSQSPSSRSPSSSPSSSSSSSASSSSSSASSSEAGSAQSDQTDFEPDTIKIEYHPHSGIGVRTVPFEEFQRYYAPQADPPLERQPWFPYRSRTDFEFAKFVLDASLSRKEVDRLLKLIHCVREGKDQLSFHSYTDIQKGWAAASTKLTPFTKHIIDVPYKNEMRSYPLWTRDVWEYLKDILRNPYLVSRMDWNAHRLYRFDEATKQFIRFYDEPLTANAAWNLQSELPAGQSPLIILVYADKTKLSSFGSAKAYPVVIKCGNLPVDIRNGEGVGGERVVGWLPILEEKAGERHKLGYINLKRIIWHESVRKIFEPIRQFSHTGVWFICGDHAERWMCPSVVILSSDYEEQCFMSLIRGAMGLFPCPICLAPKGQLCNLHLHFPLRTGKEAQRILNEALVQKTQKQHESILQAWSLRPVQNAFLELGHSDPYKALSFDRLHAFHSGLFGHHLWVEFKKHVENISNDAVKLVDVQFDMIPRWSGLIHFNEVMGLSFTDGGKYEHISKNILFASHNIMTKTASAVGYQLLCLIRQYLEMDMYAGLLVHTTWTLQDGRHAQSMWHEKLQEFTADDPEPKNWDFPKAHTHKHLWDDITAKGVTRNYNTKPNEKLHRPLKKAYQLQTNFRDVAPQILNIDHNAYVAAFMQQQLDEYDATEKAQIKAALEISRTTDNSELDTIGGGHFMLRSKQDVQTMGQLVASHQNDVAYQNFWQRLGRFLTSEYQAHGLPLPDGPRITFSADSRITPYFLINVNYESLADWRMTTDMVRCNPIFFGHPRYDCVLVQAATQFFARLIITFTCKVGDSLQPLALIQPFDRLAGPPSRTDLDLGFLRVRERPRRRSEFISLHSLLRGALLVPDFGKDRDYLVHDLVDSDMFLRMRAIKGAAL